MNLVVHQQIMIQTLRVDNVSNASVLQIGSAGTISSYGLTSNTGGFGQAGMVPAAPPETLVPLPSAAH